MCWLWLASARFAHVACVMCVLCMEWMGEMIDWLRFGYIRNDWTITITNTRTDTPLHRLRSDRRILGRGTWEEMLLLYVFIVIITEASLKVLFILSCGFVEHTSHTNISPELFVFFLLPAKQWSASLNCTAISHTHDTELQTQNRCEDATHTQSHHLVYTEHITMGCGSPHVYCRKPSVSTLIWQTNIMSSDTEKMCINFSRRSSFYLFLAPHSHRR